MNILNSAVACMFALTNILKLYVLFLFICFYQKAPLVDRVSPPRVDVVHMQ